MASWWVGPTLVPGVNMVARCPRCGCPDDHGRYLERLYPMLRQLRPLVARPSPVRALGGGQSVARLVRDGRYALDVGGWSATKAAGAVLVEIAARGMLALADAGHPPETVASLRVSARSPSRVEGER